ncbi:60S ribosomal protein L18a [Acorus gramineus]|uniref:60S ribosomal protein L18a n=1 Tax=Acorus gramineus TaxID=55184 RepID=A0AAV9A4D4_ACOGR|nr:60S ribosomal protein L18a [Acorus gramineus]
MSEGTFNITTPSESATNRPSFCWDAPSRFGRGKRSSCHDVRGFTWRCYGGWGSTLCTLGHPLGLCFYSYSCQDDYALFSGGRWGATVRMVHPIVRPVQGPCDRWSCDHTMSINVGEEVESFEQIFEEQGVWIPDTDDNVKPVIGMCFDTVEDGEKFYTSYARVAGFGVRKSTTKYRKGTEELIKRDMVCAKEGFKNTDVDKQIRIRNRENIRVGCKARIQFWKTEDGKWIVHDFFEGHVHVLSTPRKTHLLRSHREVTGTQKSLIHSFREANIFEKNPTKIHNYGIWLRYQIRTGYHNK